MKTITFVIPTHNRNALLKRTLDSLFECRPILSDTPVKVLVVENGGRFGAEKLIAHTKGWLTCEYLYVQDGNKSAALNQALNILDDSFLVFLDDDVRVSKTLAESYASAARNYGSGHFFGGGMLVDYETTPKEWLLPYLPASARGWNPPRYEGVCNGIWFMGCNWAAFADDIRRAGSFDENVGPGGISGGTGQEALMQQNLVSIGIKPVFVEEALVWHFVPASRCSVSWTLERTYKNAITAGLNSSEYRHVRSVARVPLWQIRRYLELTAKVLVCNFSRDEQKFFATRIEHQTIRGWIKGAQKARRADKN